MPRPSLHDDCRRSEPGYWLALYVRDPGNPARPYIRVGQVCSACRKTELEATFSRSDGHLEVHRY